MSESFCGKYYYWEEYNCKNEVIYFRGEKSWVEDNYEKVASSEESDLLKDYIETRDDLEESVSGESNPEKNLTTWTDKHYNFSYTLTENDIEKGEIKIDPYFVADQWKLGEKDNSGVIFHILKTCSRYKTKHEEEREIKAIYGQIKRLAEIRGVEL